MLLFCHIVFPSLLTTPPFKKKKSRWKCFHKGLTLVELPSALKAVSISVFLDISSIQHEEQQNEVPSLKKYVCSKRLKRGDIFRVSSEEYGNM